jgi:four helix bundle protein
MAKGYGIGERNLSSKPGISSRRTVRVICQIRRAAVSIPCNIAEEHVKLFRKEYQHFLGQARGSLAEIETQILIANDLDYLNEIDMNHILNLSAEVGRVSNGLLKSLREKK